MPLLPDLNTQLCRALGIADTGDVCRVTLEITAHELPRLTVERLIHRDTTADELATAVEVLRLVPQPVPAAALPDATERPGPHTA